MDKLAVHRKIIKQMLMERAELIAAGVPREEIVLAFNPPQLRPQTEFAVA
jgi:XisI protein